MFISPKSKEVNGFQIYFRDGFSYKHSGGLFTLPRTLVAEHGRIVKARAF